MIIYKYIDYWGERIFTQQRLKMSDPRNFNDPFEFLPKVRTEITDEEIEAKFNEPAYRENYYRHYLENGTIGPREDFERWLEDNKDALLAAMKVAYRARNYKPTDFRDIAARKFCVTCFSEKPDNLLMWAHYADNHKGVVIGVEREFFGPLIYKVDYDDKRVEYSPVMLGDPRTSTIVSVLKRKSPHWTYEEEHRAIIPYELCLEDGGLWFYPVYPTAIRELIFGSRIDSTLKQRLQSRMTGIFSHVQMFDSVPSEDEFTVSVTPI